MEKFGQAVRRMRRQRGLSLRAFARQVKFAYTYVGQIERGEKIGSNAFASHSDRVLEAGGILVRLYADADQQRRYGLVSADADADEQQRTPVHESDDLGLIWSPTVTTTLETVIQMWRADMQRRSFLVHSAFAVGGFTPAVRDWLISWHDTQSSHTGRRCVGSADVAVLWDSCHSFQEIDRRLGGAVARTSLVHFLDNVITPLLEGSYDDAIGRELLAVAGRLTDIAAYSAYDAHEQGMAQRYYIQALRMARAANSESLGAHILGDMTRQAYYIGDFNEAVALARAGQQAAIKAGSRCGLARCTALEARALAMQGDRVGSDDAMSRAEKAMDRAQTADELPWIRYFSYDQLQAEFAHAAEAMGRPRQVLAFARPALDADRPLERRNILVATTAARAYVDIDEIDKAAAVGLQALKLVPGVASERGLEAARAVRTKLSRHSSHAAVQEFEAKAREVLDAVPA